MTLLDHHGRPIRTEERRQALFDPLHGNQITHQARQQVINYKKD